VVTNGSIARVGAVGGVGGGGAGGVVLGGGVVVGAAGQAAHKGTNNATNVNAITPNKSFFVTSPPYLRPQTVLVFFYHKILYAHASFHNKYKEYIGLF
jgi:hypothetical protein